MNDEDIKKALECCVSTDDCKKCPLGGTHQCYHTLEENALDLIYRQQAEIERLKGNLFTISNACMQRRNEAIKEFAEKVKNYVKTHCNPYGKPIFDYDTSLKILKYLDNLLAEMVGGEK